MTNLETIVAETLSRIDFHKIEDHPNILIAARFWEDDRYEAARTIYRFMRYIDDMIDDRKALDAALSCMEKKLYADQVNSWIDCLGLDESSHPLFREVNETIRRFRIPLHFFLNFARSMVFDIHHDSFRSFEEFLDYTEGASNGPASVFVHLCCLQVKDGEYVAPDLVISDIARPCAIFSYLVHIIRDFQKDQFNNLNYFALDIMEKHRLTPSELREIARTGEIPSSFREMVREYKGIAEKYKINTAESLRALRNKLEPRYILSLEIIFHLYTKIYERIDPDHGTFSTAELNPGPEEIKASVMEGLRAGRMAIV